MSKQEEVYTKKRLRSSYITTVVSMTLVLFLLGMLGLVIMHAKLLSDRVKETLGFTVYMQKNAREAEILQLQKRLESQEYVKSTKYTSEEEAAVELKKELGEDFLGFLGFNPLSSSIEVHLKASHTSIDSIQKIEKQLLSNSDVKEVTYPKNLISAVNNNIRRISIILLGFSLLLLLISLALINNTIRLAIYSKRFIIRSMMLVGATQAFIRKPFVITGVYQGMLSALLAIMLLSGLLYFSWLNIPELQDFGNTTLIISLFGLVVLTGVLIAGISNYLAVRKYLNTKIDNLYL
jgi:cell division transport system permease protein